MSSTETLGLWLLDHKVAFLAGVAALTWASRAVLDWQSRRNANRLHAVERTALGISDRECELAAKLLQKLHLSAGERSELPEGKMRLSVLLSAARAELSRSPYLPSRLSPDDNYEGVLLEFRDDSYWIHERHEAGANRYGPRSSRQAKNIGEAVRAYVRANGGASIDGVAIDPDS